MTRRPFDSGRKDKLGRRIRTSGKTRPVDANTHDVLSAAADAAAHASWSDPHRVDALMSELADAFADAATLVSRSNINTFTNDRLQQRAATSILIQIGEAASPRNGFPQDFKDAHPTVDWNAAYGMRNILAHHYAKIEASVLWNTLIDDLPQMARDLGFK